MRYDFQKLLKHSSVRYLLVGGSAYIIEILIILEGQKLGKNGTLVVAISFWVGLIYTFILQKYFSFGDSRSHHKILLPQLLKVCALVLFNFCFTIVLTILLRHVLPLVVTRTIAIGITVLWNYYLYNRHIFKAAIVD